MSKRMLDVSLVLLTIVFLCFIVFGNEDSAARIALFGDALPETAWHAKAIYKALYDIGIGGLVSVLFYVLLVRVPENAKRRRIRRSLERRFKSFKEQCLTVMLGTVEGIIDAHKADELLEPKAFRAYFKERPIPSQDRWDVFLNRLDETGLRDILKAVEILREEVNFALGATDIPADEAFKFLKRFSAAIHSVQGTELGYDSIKPLAGFLWALFTGFNPITGYERDDAITQMIRAI